MTEPKEASRLYRQEYRDSIERLIARRQEKAKKARLQWMSPEKLCCDTDYYRRELRKMPGRPLTEEWPAVVPEMIIRERKQTDGTHEMLRVQFCIFDWQKN